MYAVLPDLDQALIDFLEAHSALVPLHGGRVGTSLEGDAPAIRIANLGGPERWPWEGVSEFQLEHWGGTKQQANLLARTSCAAIYDMRGPITGGHVVSAYPTLRPLWSPDDNTGRARYITQVGILATNA